MARVLTGPEQSDSTWVDVLIGRKSCHRCARVVQHADRPDCVEVVDVDVAVGALEADDARLAGLAG